MYVQQFRDGQHPGRQRLQHVDDLGSNHLGLGGEDLEGLGADRKVHCVAEVVLFQRNLKLRLLDGRLLLKLFPHGFTRCSAPFGRSVMLYSL